MIEASLAFPIIILVLCAVVQMLAVFYMQSVAGAALHQALLRDSGKASGTFFFDGEMVGTDRPDTKGGLSHSHPAKEGSFRVASPGFGLLSEGVGWEVKDSSYIIDERRYRLIKDMAGEVFRIDED